MTMKLLCLIALVVLLTFSQSDAGEIEQKQQYRRSDVDWDDFEDLPKTYRNRRDEDEDEEEDDHGDEDDEDDGDQTSNIVRAITMVVILVVSMIFGMLPLKTLSLKYRSRIASIANCFGGGVFFGTCFMHLIPEVKLQINGYVKYVEREGILSDEPLEFLKKLPIPEFLECSGFLLILSVEKIAESAKKIRPLTQRFSVFISAKKLNSAKKLVNKQQDLEAIPDGCEGDHENEEECDQCHSDNTDNESNHERKMSEQSIKSCSSSKSNSKKKRMVPKAFLSAMKGNLYNRVENRGPEEPTVPGQQKKSAAMLILALSIHSFFEGLAIGVERTEAVFIQLAAAITVHKCVIAFAVGSRLIHCGKSIKEMFWCLFCMCVMTPIGVSLAMLIVRALDEYTILIVSGSIQGVSTGFFLYITFAEMLFQEMKTKQDSFLKVSFITLGVLLVTASTIWHNWKGAHAHD